MSTMQTASKSIAFFKFFLILWVVFIPLKTVFYQIAWVGLIVSFLGYCFSVSTCRLEFKETVAKFKDIILLFGAILLALVIASLHNPAHQVVHWRWLLSYIFQYFVIFFILLHMYRKNVFTLSFLTKTILAVLFIYALDGLWQLAFGYDLLRHKIGSLAIGLPGPTHNRNVYGMLMAITAFVSFALAIEKFKTLRQKERIFLWALFLVALVDLLLSYSRASWLFFVTAAGIFMFFSMKRGLLNNKLLYGALLLVIGIAVILYLVDPHLQHRFMQLLHGQSSHRLQMWPLAIIEIKKHWLFGHGLVHSLYFLYKVEQTRYIQNSLLEILFTVGVFGFIFYTWLLLVVLKQILKNRDILQLGFFFGFLVISLFDHSMIKGSIQLSILTIFAFFVFKERLAHVQ